MGEELPEAGHTKVETILPTESIENIVTTKPIETVKAWAGIFLCYGIVGLIGLESLILIIYFFFATYSLKSLASPSPRRRFRCLWGSGARWLTMW